MKYGYARVSTAGQDLESQLQTLKKEGCETIFSEKYTGTKTDRPKFTEMLGLLKEGDTLMVTKLDRFARTASKGTELIKELLNKGIKVHVLNMGLIEDTPTGRLIINIMGGFAEFGRDMIVERTQEGKAIARKKADYTEGRPKKFNKESLDHAMELLEKHSFTQVETMTRISKSTLVRESRKRKGKAFENENSVI